MSIRAAKANLDVFADVWSVVRNVDNGVTNGASPALPYLVIAQGTMAAAAGVYTAATSFSETRQAIKCGDKQGIVLGTWGTLAGLAQTALGVAATTCGSANCAGNTPLAAGDGDAISPALMSVYGLFLIKSVVMLRYTDEFERALLLDDQGLKDFLAKQSDAQIERVVGEECAALIQSGSVDMDRLRYAIARGCLMTKITHFTICGICALGMVATYASFLLADVCPILAAILYAIAATLWIFIDYAPLRCKLRETLADRILGPFVPAKAVEKEVVVTEVPGERESERWPRWLSFPIQAIATMA